MKRSYIAKRFQSSGAGLSLDTEALAKYKDIIDLSIGDTDFTTDESIINAAFRDAKAGHTHYGDPKGDPELIDAVCRAWEEDFGQRLPRDHVLVSASSCLGMALVMLAILDPGDEVIVPAITFVATMAYPLSIGAKLVFADIVPGTVNMDPEDVARKITPRTKMIVPVHIAGYPVDMDPIMKLAKEHDILVLEDAAHAFGAMYKGRHLGTIGDFGSFSFHEVKNITSFGEGGIVCTNVPGFGPDMKRARFLGLDFSAPIKDWLYNITPIPGKNRPFVAQNSSTTEIQGLGLSLQVARNEEIIAKRRAAAEYLNKRLSVCDAIIPQPLGNDEIKPSFHMYLLHIDPAKAGGDIQVLKRKLEEKGVTNIPHFGPLYRFKVVSDLGYDPDEIAKTCPVCEEMFYHRFTHLPLYGLSDEQFEYMADAILESIAEMQRGE